jgi:hypothetical protein
MTPVTIVNGISSSPNLLYGVSDKYTPVGFTVRPTDKEIEISIGVIIFGYDMPS